MRVAVSSDTNVGLDAPVAGHFGRCPFFTLIDLEDGKITTVQVVSNPHYPQHEPGAIPEFIHSQAANVMLAGGMGGRAVAFFEQFGIQPVTGAAGTVRQSIERYLGGSLTGWAPCDESVEHGHGHVGGQN